MKLGLIHYNFPQFSLDEFFAYAAGTGYGYVELQWRDVWDEADPDDAPERRAEDVRRRLEAHGLKVSALAAGNDFVLLDPDEIDRQVARMRRICRLAGLLGTRIIRTEGGSPKPEVPKARWVEAMAGCLKRCLEFVEPEGFYLAVDNHGLVTNDAELQLELFTKVGSRHVGANLDTMNYRWAGHDLQTVNRFYELIAPHTFHTHMKDGRDSRENYVGLALGEGQIDLHHAVRCLKKAGYDGVWCAEYEGREPSDIGYRKCYEWLRKHVGAA